jgi:NAD(P)-dependent dehydrogenase (short-subunit alcohol dehydrogenase family)
VEVVDMDLKDKAALVTGASRGLGRALAARLAREGARVVLVARDEARVEAAAEAIRREGGLAFAVAGDVGESQAAHRIVGRAAALAGAIDVLVNNASTLGPTPLKWLLDTPSQDFERAFAVNVIGPFRLTKLVAMAMAVRKRGTIVNVTSDASVNAYPNWGAYGASKAALDHLTRIWAAELEATGVRCFAVDPGEMNTQMHADAIPDADCALLESPELVADRIVRLIARDDASISGTRIEARADVRQ